MIAPLDLTAQHRRIVLGILQAHLPPGMRIWVFGSRAKGRARRYSDLDLAIDAGRRLTVDETAILREDFDQCDLPFRVDIVDWQAIAPAFRRQIATECRALDDDTAGP